MKLEALCKRMREDAQKLKEEKATLEGMVEFHDELITEIAKEIGLDHMGKYAKEEEDMDDDNGRDAATPPTAAPPLDATPPAAAAPEEVIMEEDPVEMVPEQEAPVAHEVILVDAEPKLLQPSLYRMLTRDYEESPLRMMDDLDDMDDLNEAYSDMDEWFSEDGSNDRD
jgi:hypothetical protein